VARKGFLVAPSEVSRLAMRWGRLSFLSLFSFLEFISAFALVALPYIKKIYKL